LAPLWDAPGLTGFRHTVVTDLLEAGGALNMLLWSSPGTCPRRMLEHYSHLRLKARKARRCCGWRNGGRRRAP